MRRLVRRPPCGRSVLYHLLACNACLTIGRERLATRRQRWLRDRRGRHWCSGLDRCGGGGWLRRGGDIARWRRPCAVIDGIRVSRRRCPRSTITLQIGRACYILSVGVSWWRRPYAISKRVSSLCHKESTCSVCVQPSLRRNERQSRRLSFDDTRYLPPSRTQSS